MWICISKLVSLLLFHVVASRGSISSSLTSGYSAAWGSKERGGAWLLRHSETLFLRFANNRRQLSLDRGGGENCKRASGLTSIQFALGDFLTHINLFSCFPRCDHIWKLWIFPPRPRLSQCRSRTHSIKYCFTSIMRSFLLYWFIR